MNYDKWQKFLNSHANDLLIDGKTLAKDWPTCPTADCGNKVCMWGGEQLCYPCSVAKIGQDKMDLRYVETH